MVHKCFSDCNICSGNCFYAGILLLKSIQFRHFFGECFLVVVRSSFKSFHEQTHFTFLIKF